MLCIVYGQVLRTTRTFKKEQASKKEDHTHTYSPSIYIYMPMSSCLYTLSRSRHTHHPCQIPNSAQLGSPELN